MRIATETIGSHGLTKITLHGRGRVVLEVMARAPKPIMGLRALKAELKKFTKEAHRYVDDLIEKETNKKKGGK